MAKIKDVYKCDVCGIIVEVTHGGGGTLSCCGKPMRLIVENTVDAAVEKHIPAVEKNGDEIIVKVGSVEHPMTEQHYIEWIEVNTENKVYTKLLLKFLLNKKLSLIKSIISDKIKHTTFFYTL